MSGAWLVFWGLLGLIVAPLLLNLLAAEAYSWCPRWAERFVRLHSSRLPKALGERMVEEWRATIDETPGNLAKLLVALDLFRATPQLKHEFLYSTVPYRPIFDFFSRLWDIVFAACGLILCLPLALLLALAIRLESRGPVLIKDLRVGQHRRVFSLYQLRTGRACDGGECGLKGREHYHLTRVGRLLERMRLDELGLLLNVLRGHMSLVGPTPINPTLAANSPTIPPEMFSVRPGLTGRAQVSMAPTTTPLTTETFRQWREERFALDVEYVRNRGLRENLRIMAATVTIVLFSRK